MDYLSVIRSQYKAALEMLRQTVTKCPDGMWDDPADKTKFWHLVYHALFYAHLYLQESEQKFIPWQKHRKDYQFIGPVPWPPHYQPEIGDPYTKDEILTYWEVCLQQIDECMKQFEPEAKSGFDWLPFNKLELQFYNIRHIQQHTGELMERLGSRARIEIDWIGSRHN